MFSHPNMQLAGNTFRYPTPRKRTSSSFLDADTITDQSLKNVIFGLKTQDPARSLQYLANILQPQNVLIPINALEGVIGIKKLIFSAQGISDEKVKNFKLIPKLMNLLFQKYHRQINFKAACCLIDLSAKSSECCQMIVKYGSIQVLLSAIKQNSYIQSLMLGIIGNLCMEKAEFRDLILNRYGLQINQEYFNKYSTPSNSPVSSVEFIIIWVLTTFLFKKPLPQNLDFGNILERITQIIQYFKYQRYSKENQVEVMLNCFNVIQELYDFHDKTRVAGLFQIMKMYNKNGGISAYGGRPNQTYLIAILRIINKYMKIPRNKNMPVHQQYIENIGDKVLALLKLIDSDRIECNNLIFEIIGRAEDNFNFNQEERLVIGKQLLGLMKSADDQRLLILIKICLKFKGTKFSGSIKAVNAIRRLLSSSSNQNIMMGLKLTIAICQQNYQRYYNERSIEIADKFQKKIKKLLKGVNLYEFKEMRHSECFMISNMYCQLQERLRVWPDSEEFIRLI